MSNKPDENPYLPYPDGPGPWAFYPPGERQAALLNVKQDPQGFLIYIHEKRNEEGKVERIAIPTHNMHGSWWRRVLLPELPNKFFYAQHPSGMKPPEVEPTPEIPLPAVNPELLQKLHALAAKDKPVCAQPETPVPPPDGIATS